MWTLVPRESRPNARRSDSGVGHDRHRDRNDHEYNADQHDRPRTASVVGKLGTGEADCRQHDRPQDQHTARKRRDPADSNYFSDAESERTASVAEEYKEAERAERAERAAAGLDEDFGGPELVTQKENRPPSKLKLVKSAQQAEQALTPPRKMAGRGRGRPGGLKGVTWEYDPSIKLESKPIELFPVRILSCK